MSSEQIPNRDAEYSPWITTFASVATANATLLNLSGGQTAALTGMASAFSVALSDNIAAKAAAKGKAATKRDLRKTSDTLFRSTAKLINANPNVSSDLKSELGINVAPSPSGPVVPVIDVSAEGFANGVNKVKWNRNGNPSTTTFQIEANHGGSSPWVIVGTTNRIRFSHTGQTPGVLTFYRVISQRGGVQSVPSTQTSVYGPEVTPVLTLSQAA